MSLFRKVPMLSGYLFLFWYENSRFWGEIIKTKALDRKMVAGGVRKRSNVRVLPEKSASSRRRLLRHLVFLAEKARSPLRAGIEMRHRRERHDDRLRSRAVQRIPCQKQRWYGQYCN